MQIRFEYNYVRHILFEFYCFFSIEARIITYVDINNNNDCSFCARRIRVNR